MNVGDLVQWTHVREYELTIKFFAMEGKILEINGELATVKNRESGRKYQVKLAHLRTLDEVNELTELVMGKKRKGA
jgi:hypothetical protein